MPAQTAFDFTSHYSAAEITIFLKTARSTFRPAASRLIKLPLFPGPALLPFITVIFPRRRKQFRRESACCRGNIFSPLEIPSAAEMYASGRPRQIYDIESGGLAIRGRINEIPRIFRARVRIFITGAFSRRVHERIRSCA